MTKVILKKIGESESSQIHAADWDSYNFGGENKLSLPIEYELKGNLVCPIEIGKPIEVLREERNGIKVMGNFTSSEVISIFEIDSTNFIWHIKTQNSLYEVTYKYENK